MSVWNPWHGCHKISAGCQNCYVYRSDSRHGKDSSKISKNNDFDLPLRKNRAGEYKLQNDELVYTCFTSDFFLPEADEWRKEIWDIIRLRSDLVFLIITKRIDRFTVSLPHDWSDGWDNVIICSTTENQEMVDYRLPTFLNLPIKHKMIICEPLLEAVNLRDYLKSGQIIKVIAGGESGNNARPCNFDWILSLRKQCIENSIFFHFKQTGARFIKNGRGYNIPRRYQHAQAKRANVDVTTIYDEQP